MIFINKEQVNKIVLTLSETSTLTNPNYLFKFVNEFNDTPNPIYFTTQDESIHTNRYNMFELIENSTGSTTGGTSVALNLMPGQYKYTVYEASASTLSVSATTGVVIETVWMIVDGGATFQNLIEPNQNTTKSVYL